jgi:hypothetical protein
MGTGKPRRRVDWAGIVQLFLLASIALGVVTLFSDIQEVARADHRVEVLVDSDHAQAPDVAGHLKPGATVRSYASVRVAVDHPGTRQRILDVLAHYPMRVGFIVVLYLLWRLVARARYTDPFTVATVRRIRVLGAVVLFGGGLVLLGSDAANDALARTMVDGSVWPTTAANPITPWLLAGLALFAAAQVVDRGRVMRAELEEVI